MMLTLAVAAWRSPSSKWPGAAARARPIRAMMAGQQGRAHVACAEADRPGTSTYALGARDLAGFRRGIGTMIAFMLLAVVVPSYSEWVTQLIRVRWRRWFTGHYITRWIGPHAYRGGLLSVRAGRLPGRADRGGAADEATSDLDDATEAKVYEVLAQQMPNAALLVVAERPGALERLPRRWTLSESAGGHVALEAT